ncbi:MAG: hypothetical protein QOJ73_1546 [Streptosporangiaceae bacterium]|jgi:transcriptional regulator with XRE-family HTH domain|nr:hypothetical protein [Streptosporangiaceae bacterium]
MDLVNPVVQPECRHIALAQAVATCLIKYRTDHQLSQSALGHRLGMKQPAIARLEAADHEPSLGTLARLARGLGLEFHIVITPAAFGLRETA